MSFERLRKRKLDILKEDAKKGLLEISYEKNFEIIEMEIGNQDHIHLFVSAHPKIQPSYIVKMLKGISARKLLLRFPELKRKLYKGHLWNPSYYIETIGSISEDVIKRYIEKQGRK